MSVNKKKKQRHVNMEMYQQTNSKIIYKCYCTWKERIFLEVVKNHTEAKKCHCENKM